MILRDALQAIPKDSFDIVLLDNPPSLDLMAVNAYVAATDILIPVQCEAYALNGLSSLLEDIKRVTKRLNPALSLLAVLPTMYDGRKKLSQDVLQALRDGFPGKVCTSVIRDSVALAEAPSHGHSIFQHDPKGYGAQDYAALGLEICERIEQEVTHGA